MKETEALLGLQKIDLELMRYAKTLRAMPQTYARWVRRRLPVQPIRSIGA